MVTFVCTQRLIASIGCKGGRREPEPRAGVVCELRLEYVR